MTSGVPMRSAAASASRSGARMRTPSGRSAVTRVKGGAPRQAGWKGWCATVQLCTVAVPCASTQSWSKPWHTAQSGRG